MSDGPSHFATTDGGVTGLHDVDASTALEAPSLDTKFNSLRAAILPFACWKVDNLRFAFDSSAVQPGLRDDLANLLDQGAGAPQIPPESLSTAAAHGADRACQGYTIPLLDTILVVVNTSCTAPRARPPCSAASAPVWPSATRSGAMASWVSMRSMLPRKLASVRVRAPVMRRS